MCIICALFYHKTLGLCPRRNNKKGIMNFSKTIKTFVTTILVAATSLPTIAQDKLAMQAPVDRKLKVLDTLALQSVLENPLASASRLKVLLWYRPPCEVS